MRSVVDLPQPEGPSRIMNSPSRMVQVDLRRPRPTSAG